jgi:hypothetical protein
VASAGRAAARVEPFTFEEAGRRFRRLVLARRGRKPISKSQQRSPSEKAASAGGKLRPLLGRSYLEGQLPIENARGGKSFPAESALRCGKTDDHLTVRLARSVERQPDDVAKIVTAVAVSRLGEGVRQLPLLRFVAPLCCGVRDDVVRLALRADGCGASPLPAKDHARLLGRTKWIEK